MRFVDEFRDRVRVEALARAIEQVTTKSWRIMEVCGGQTHNIVKYGLDQLLPAGVELIHGPGCPVCVTPTEKIDAAIAIASEPGVIFCSYGDMLRVPGTSSDLLTAKAQGADVRVVHSPLEAVTVAQENPLRQVVFFAVGFETTAPANATAVFAAASLGVNNFSMIVAHVLVPPALAAILKTKENSVQGFLAAGHVCTIMGTSEYEPIAANYCVPIVVTGFEPVDILQGILMCVRQLEAGLYTVENQYDRSVRSHGNEAARTMISEVFSPKDSGWRGLGELAKSGLGFNPRYESYDAERRFRFVASRSLPASICRAGAVLTGQIKPPACPAFGKACTPERPLGAPMVSAEGACAAYYHYRLRYQMEDSASAAQLP
jgi:hydrogenase expression/formation protein HypD